MGKIILEGYSVDGRRTFYLALYDAWTGNNAKPTLYFYDTAGYLIMSRVETYRNNAYGSGFFKYYVNSGGNPSIAISIDSDYYYLYDSIGIAGHTTKIRLTIASHGYTNYHSTLEEWKFDDYVEYNAGTYFHHDYYYYYYIEYDCPYLGYYRWYSLMYDGYYAPDYGCWYNHASYFTYSDINQAHLRYLLRFVKDLN